MKREIVRDPVFLSIPSEKATRDDLPVGRDLMDTLAAHRGQCVGMAANMIGIRKRILIVNLSLGDFVMFNPVILKKEDVCDTEEGCLSIPGVRSVKRWKTIEVEYRDMDWKLQRRTFKDLFAQVIQHEMDHFEGKLV